MKHNNKHEQQRHGHEAADDETRRIAWHPAFVEALQMELRAYRDVLEFKAEHQLTAEPLKIDCVVLKKAKNIVIKKNIAAIFRQWNILEYKSPSDYVSVNDFYKIYGYACLYAALQKVPVTEITVSFVQSRRPGKLLEHIRRERGYTIEKSGGGIYTVKGDILPIQVIDSSQLPEAENLWLKHLSNRLDSAAIDKIGAAAHRQGKEAPIRAYLDVVARANMQSVEEYGMMRKRKTKAKTLEEVFEKIGWTADWEAKGRAMGKAEGRAYEANAIAQNMVNMGLPFETIVSATRLEPEKVKALYASTAGESVSQCYPLPR
jgi:hypothetical protein